MYSKLNADKNEIKKILSKVMLQASEYYETLESRFVAPEFFPAKEPFQLPANGLGAMSALDQFNACYEKYITASAGPRYFGYVVGGATPAAVAGDILTTIYDQNAFGIPGTLEHEIEAEALNMLKELLGIDQSFSGTFVTGATMSNFVSLANARGRIAEKQGLSFTEEGMFDLKRPVILAGSPHSSIFKAIDMLGFGRKSVHLVPQNENSESVDIEQLRAMLAANIENECIVIASAGSVNTGDFDDLQAIGELKSAFDFWLHVDGAFGGIAGCSPEYAYLLEGMNLADSITLDAHKWLNVPYDSAVQFTRHKKLQSEIFYNSSAYLNETSENPAIFNLTPENSRRLRALPLWFSLMAYGKNGYAEIVERNCEVAQGFADRINQSKWFRLLATPKINIVCFTFDIEAEKITPALVNTFLNRISKTGKAFFTSTIYHGQPAIRIAVSNWQTAEDDLGIAWSCLIETAEGLFDAR
ncbi:MAG: pyridoxal-dependent decarboxylase [Bacillota bacterium]|nr:pyridoxal-dependent decarboxylase [Bacillota bacterium]